MSNTLEHTELYQKITDICFENGGVTKPMVDKLMNLITLHTQEAETRARINEHSELWDIVPSFAEHVGTVKEISDLRVLKLEAQLTNPTEAGEL